MSLAESLFARIQKQRDLMQAMDDELRRISVTVSSRDQIVKVQVNGVCAMTGLWLGSDARRMQADALAKLIVDTAEAAAQHAAERQRFLIREFNQRFEALRNEPLTMWDGTVFIPSR